MDQELERLAQEAPPSSLSEASEMDDSSTIRLLAAANNERGDLFTRLTKDLFFALGYDNLRLDVHKSGREVDLQGEHRFEPRRVIGECKAHAAKMGGDELNKFFGVLARERKKCAPTPVAGYFVSLGGFTETGIDQEVESGDDRLILLNAGDVVQELERCRVVVSGTEAAERAGHCAQHAGLGNAALDGAELLGHERGYLWAIFYSNEKERTHFALIHADGTPLAAAIARDVIDADRLCGGTLHSLRYLAPPTPPPDRLALAAKSAHAYRQWLGEDCGFIHLDGLPADTDLSTTRLKLERLFVPLKAIFLPKREKEQTEAEKPPEEKVLSIGEALERSPHLALLAMPGGGKSTLVKRLATAYAFPERRGEVADDLPQRQWLPLILRCRELRDRAHRPILELLDDIPRYAGMNADECAIFQETTHSALRAGQVLLLVDGLDEISDEGARQAFANHLRTFIAVFPQAALVVTSREAGFRLVAGVVAGACDQAKLAPLDEADVLNLCERWHVEVVGDNDKVRAEAKALGRTIWDNQRIRMLTENPLLLTTLLVVKRWVRELPRSRAALYREAIRVLVRTWNVEGYAPLDEEETLAQLSYVACAMMEEGKQQIGQKALLKLLQSARQELEAELQFSRISPQEFIERIEYRSSLLMQTGHERTDGVLEPVYEFRHLTFQEYLAARGYVEEQYRGRDSGQSLADVLERHFEDEHWLEIVPLAAVLAGRKAEELIKRLIAVCKRRKRPQKTRPKNLEEDPLGILLQRCILDEVQVTGPTLRAALLELGCSHGVWHSDRDKRWIGTVLGGKFGAIFQEVTEQAYLAGGSGIEDYVETIERIALHLNFGDQGPVLSDEVATALLCALEDGDRLERIRAALVCMNLAYLADREGPATETEALRVRFQSLSVGLNRMLTACDVPSVVVASWAYAWLGERMLVKAPEPEILLAFYRSWRQIESKQEARYSGWALASQQLLPRDTFASGVWGDCDLFLRQAVTDGDDWRLGELRRGALVVGWYRRAPWTDLELVEQLSKIMMESGPTQPPTIRALLEKLGDAGRRVLDEQERRRTPEREARQKETKPDKVPRQAARRPRMPRR
jgi:hypothetical protein